MFRLKRYSHLLGLRYISSFLKAKGHAVTLKDFQGTEINSMERKPNAVIEKLINAISIIVRRDYDIIGISIPFSHSAVIAEQVIRNIKTKTPIVIGGAFPSSQPDLALKIGADYIIIGEGEIAFQELIEYLSNGRAANLPNYIIKRGENIEIKRKPCIVENLDELPFPDILIKDINSYVCKNQRNIRDIRSTSIITSRGCPFLCEFCSIHNINGSSWRGRTPQNVIDEIHFLYKKLKIGNIEIEDDNFTFQEDRCLEILNGMHDINNKISWTAPNGLRIDTINEKMVEVFKKTNCRYLYIALEHGDEYTLNKVINKKLDLKYVEYIVGILYKYKIKCFIFVLYAYPGETESGFNNAIKFYLKLKEINPHIEYSFMLPEPYPGTALWSRSINNKWIDIKCFEDTFNIYKYFSSPPWIMTDCLDYSTIIKRGELLRKLFYSKQTYVEIINKYPPTTDR